MVFNQITSELNLCDSQTQSLASCELLVWNFFKVFPHLERVPFKLRYCSIFKVLCGAPSRAGSSFIISRGARFVKRFFRDFFERPFRPRPPRGVRARHARGLPHSDTPGSNRACRSPGNFAACRVLRRLWKPRHPPCALISFVLRPPAKRRAALVIAPADRARADRPLLLSFV